MKIFHPLLGFSLAMLIHPAAAAEWPMYRGSAHDGISSETAWSSDWPGEPPVLWEAEVGLGFASFTVVEGRVYTTGHADEKDAIFCLDAASGEEKWRYAYAADIGAKFYEGGTSATPTVAGGRVYHLSRWGDVFCLDAATGSVLWSRNLVKDHGFVIPDWGFAGSPLVQGDRVFLNVGSGGVALNAADGTDVWISGKEEAAGYSTPYPVDLAGTAALILSTDRSYTAVERDTGKPLWQIEWKTRYGVNAADPIVHEERLFLSSGYNKGCALFQLHGTSQPEPVWENKELRNQFSSSILLGGRLFGIHDDYDKRPALRCLDWATGAVLWEEKAIGFGALSAAGDRLIVQTQKGELVIVKAAAEYDELARAQVLAGRCWTTPVLSDGRLLVRNAEGTVKCLNLQ